MPLRYSTNFGESYYNHACLISSNKDILDLDTGKKNIFNTLKGWWKDLFLLSYNDERARRYYISTLEMRKERAKQYCIYKNTIHPYSKFRMFWSSFLIPVILLNIAIFYDSTSIYQSNNPWQYYFLNVILEFLLLFDIYLNKKTGYIDSSTKEIILNDRRAMLHYASRKLFLHVISSIPVQTLMFIKYGTNINCSLCKANKFVSTLELIGVLRLYRLYDMSSCWTIERRSFRVKTCLKFLRIGVLGFTSVTYLIYVSDIISGLTIQCTGKLDIRSYYSKILGIRFGTDTPPSKFTLYCIEIARVCKSFLLFSLSLMPRPHFPDKLSTLLAYIISMFFYMWSTVEFYFLISRMKFPQELLITNIDKALNLIRWRRLPDSFGAKVKRYYSTNVSRLRITEKQNSLYKSIPNFFKRQRAIHCYISMVNRIPYFAEWPRELLEKIVEMLYEEIYLEGDIVSEPSIPSDGLIIVDVGVLAVYSMQDKEIEHLVDGDFFCELSLVTDREIRMSSVVALTPCQVLFLDKISFRKLMREYPNLFYNLKHELTAKYATQHATRMEPQQPSSRK